MLENRSAYNSQTSPVTPILFYFPNPNSDDRVQFSWHISKTTLIIYTYIYLLPSTYIYLQHYAQTQPFLRIQFPHLVVSGDLLATTLVLNDAETLDPKFCMLCYVRRDIGIIHYNFLLDLKS